MTLRISSPEREGVYQGSKWLKFQVLCDREELEQLFKRLDPFFIVPLTGIVDGKTLAQDYFLDVWGACVDCLENGAVPKEDLLRKILACAFAEDLESFWLQPVAGRGYLAKISKPVIQVQAHWFTYSSVDEVFRPMSMGVGSIFWGLQFSYPQIYQDPATMELKETHRSDLFEKLRFWVRDVTRATPFLVNGKKVNVPIRLGKQCFSWIGRHPQLIEQNIGVVHG